MRHILFTLIMTMTTQAGAKELTVQKLGQSFQPIIVGEGADDENSATALQRHSKSYPGFNYEAHRYHTRELRERIRLLESAVRQLQEEVYRLKTQDNEYGSNRRPGFTCFLNTPFNGTFYGKGETKLEAKAKTLNECEKKDKGYCNANQVSCEKID
jgi:hypothetical protein